jgi:serine/threonine-protein kinase
MQHLNASPPRPSEVAAAVPAFVDAAVQRALAKAPADRWPTAVEFARALAGADRDVTGATSLVPVEAPGWLGQYELRERIGRGRFGSEIYAAVHRALGHPVAIRALRRGAHPKWDLGRDRFLREARLLQVSHPSVMQVRDYGEDGDVVYVVTELYEGASLRDLLMREGFLPWPRLAPLVRQLASAASAVHKRGGLLCGLSPEMIRMSRDDEGERLVVSSGGVCEMQDLTAMLSDEAVRGAGRPDQELYYVAPELHLGQAPDVRSDVFTIGAIAYEMATGRRPYEAATVPMLLGAMLRTRPTDPRHEQPSLPSAAADTLLLAVGADQATRPASAAEFGTAFAG